MLRSKGKGARHRFHPLRCLFCLLTQFCSSWRRVLQRRWVSVFSMWELTLWGVPRGRPPFLGMWELPSGPGAWASSRAWAMGCPWRVPMRERWSARRSGYRDVRDGLPAAGIGVWAMGCPRWVPGRERWAAGSGQSHRSGWQSLLPLSLLFCASREKKGEVGHCFFLLDKWKKQKSSSASTQLNKRWSKKGKWPHLIKKSEME